MDKSIIKNFIRYVSLNIFGMVGLSCYILADTFFISKALGAKGIAALNFSIPVYSIIQGVGLMIGIGGATRYSILKAQNKEQNANGIFTQCIRLGLGVGGIFFIMGLTSSKHLALLLEADLSTLPLTKTYLSTILCFAPFFIVNNILLIFVRNDNNPNLSMIAMLVGSISNIILDYIFIFPLGMGMFGAVFATSLAPIISLGVLMTHFVRGQNSFTWIRSKISWAAMGEVIQLGLSSFINEVSSAVVLITFNLLILNLEGNVGVASYGIIANIAFVGIAIFTGIAQGVQPLISKSYGEGDANGVQTVLKLAVFTSLVIAALTYGGVFLTADSIIQIFNSEQSLKIAELAKPGLRIYFMGFFFAGINIVMTLYLGATEQAKNAFVISILRGCVVIVPSVLLLGRWFEMTGIWSAFVFTEFIVTMAVLFVTNGRKETKMLSPGMNMS